MSWTITDHECYINTSIGKIKIKPRPHGRLCDVYIGNLGLFMVEAGRLGIAKGLAVTKLTSRAKSMSNYRYDFWHALDSVAVKTPLGNLSVRDSDKGYNVYLNQKRIFKKLCNVGLTTVATYSLRQALENFIQQIND